MESASELDTLGRIIIAIKTYRHQTGDCQNPASNESANIWLRQRLSIQDWVLWQRLRISQQLTSPPSAAATA